MELGPVLVVFLLLAGVESALTYNVFVSRDGNLVCGGVVFNQNTVLTAANCVDEDGSYTVTCGAGSVGSEGQTRDVGIIVKHPGYVNAMDSPQNNIAVLRLSLPFQLIGNCQVANFDTDVNADYAGERIVISGYGDTSGEGGGAGTLMYAQMDAMSSEDCSKAWGKSVDTRTVICLKGINGTSACKGDEGGPASYGDTVIGLASFWAPGCTSEPQKPNVYTRVAAFLDWVKDVSGDGGATLYSTEL